MIKAKEYIETNGGAVRIHCEPNHAYILREDVYRLMEEYSALKNLPSSQVIIESAKPCCQNEDLRYNKHSISVGDNAGTYKSLSYQYCNSCGETFDEDLS